MRDPVGSCYYNSLYQDVKRYSKHGEYFFKELMAVFQQRAELELNYAKGIQKLAGRLLRASKGMSNNSTYSAWCHVSDEMYSTADTHRTLGNAFQQEAVLELRQVLDEHSKRKRPLDNHVEKTGKLLTANWNEQLKMKKKLVGITREHEALVNFVETNKHICTEKEKQKMLNRLTKSAQTQAKLDEEYFSRNMEGHQVRLKWENTLKNCYQIIQELEKQRLEILSTTLDRYRLHISGFGQSLMQGQRGVEQAMQRVDLQKDIQALVEETSATAQENKADFLMADYFQMEWVIHVPRILRQDDLIFVLNCCCFFMIGLLKLMKSNSDNPSSANQKNMKETRQLLEETTLKQDLLEATHYKVSLSLVALGECRAIHRFSHSISKWKDKDCEHSVIQLTRPVVMRKSSRTRLSPRQTSSMYNKGAPPPDQGPPHPEQGPP
ncbi:nostrin isoform X2 [Gadus macrocephalus]|uniref:nostrin isoform X2 n=1 Tax=Gadus macrocephalus TaxID=80720 RepID=UPI0028CB7839|nr:nostrin isoform X2 [Gadus macrocephalus]